LPASAALVLALASGFLLGSLPFGYWFGRLRGINLLKVGSGSIGATNVVRNLGWPLGITCFLLDVVKGGTSVLIAKHLVPISVPGGREIWVVLAGVLAVVSHSYSFWLGFRGGRGVAAALGLVIAISPLVGALSFGTWVVVLALGRYVSLASVLAVASAPVWATLQGLDRTYVVFIALAALVIVLRHIPNLRRLAAGTEPRVGGKRPAPEPGDRNV